MNFNYDDCFSKGSLVGKWARSFGLTGNWQLATGSWPGMRERGRFGGRDDGSGGGPFWRCGNDADVFLSHVGLRGLQLGKEVGN